MEKTVKVLEFKDVTEFSKYMLAYVMKHKAKWDTSVSIKIGTMSASSIASVNNFYNIPKTGVKADKKLLCQWYVLANTVDYRKAKDGNTHHSIGKWCIPTLKAVHKMSDKDIKSLLTQGKTKKESIPEVTA